VTPLEATADTLAVDDFISQLRELRWLRRETGVDLAPLGLDPPRRTLRLVLPSGRLAIDLGAPLAGGDRVPVILREDAVAGRDRSTVYVVPAWLLESLTRPPDAWRARDLLPGSRYQVEAVRLAPAGAPPVELRRQAGETGFRVLGEGLAAPDWADSRRLEELLGAVEGLRVETFLEGRDPAELGLEPPTATLEVELRGAPEPFRLELGSPLAEDGGYPARADRQLFTLRTGLLPLLRLPAAGWRALDLTRVEPYAVEGLTVVQGGETLQLHRGEGVWRRGDTEIPGAAVVDLVDFVTEARASALRVEVPPETLDAPALVLRLAAGGEGRSTETLSFQPLAGGEEMAVAHRERAVVLRWDGAGYRELLERLAALQEALREAPVDG
jgi:hypothetical protein